MWFLLQNGDLLIPFPTYTPLFSPNSFSAVWESQAFSVISREARFCPQMAGLEGDGQRARPPIGVRSRPRAHAHAPPLRLVPATKVRPAGSPGKAELDHEESPGLRAAGERFCKRQPHRFSEPERGAPSSAPGALLTPSASSVASTQARSPHPQAWESIRKLKRKPIIGNLTGLQV